MHVSEVLFRLTPPPFLSILASNHACTSLSRKHCNNAQFHPVWKRTATLRPYQRIVVETDERASAPARRPQCQAGQQSTGSTGLGQEGEPGTEGAMRPAFMLR